LKLDGIKTKGFESPPVGEVNAPMRLKTGLKEGSKGSKASTLLLDG
jgi:hypothetical protein